MQMRYLWMLFCLLWHLNSYANNESKRDFPAQSFGISPDGKTLNSRSIQAAIDYISSQGGGRLVFTPGDYVTGSIYLKSNVTLHLEAGASILGSTNPHDYTKDLKVNWQSLIFAIKQQNIGITGAGTINGRGFITAMNALNNVQRGILVDELKYDRVREWNRPENIYFRECQHIVIKDITLKDPASWNQTYDQCQHLLIDGIKVDSKSYWNNDGLDLVDSKDVIVRNSYFDAADDAICLKSHDKNSSCENILIENCTARSSASGLKFGTVSRGGFKNVTVKNLTVIDTYRSAITFAAVDGGFVENIVVDGMRALNTGNIIYLRIGDRAKDKKNPTMKNITIKNVYAEVALNKPDAGYSYEGPIEDMPRNISPASIVGLPNHKIQQVTLENVEIVYPGAGNPNFAKRGVTAAELEAIPEMPEAYPEFSQFKELPAWAFYIRHAEGIVFKNVTFKALNQDYRPAIVTDDVQNSIFTATKISEPKEAKKKQFIFHNSKNTKIN